MLPKMQTSYSIFIDFQLTLLRWPKLPPKKNFIYSRSPWVVDRTLPWLEDLTRFTLSIQVSVCFNTVKAGYKNTQYKNISDYKNTVAADQN